MKHEDVKVERMKNLGLNYYGGSIEYDKDEWDHDNTNKLEIMEWLIECIGAPYLWSVVDPNTAYKWDDTLSYPRAHVISNNYFFKDKKDALWFSLRWM